jgi:hypothetical protein
MGIEEGDLLTTVSGWICDYFTRVGAGLGGVVRVGVVIAPSGADAH